MMKFLLRVILIAICTPVAPVAIAGVVLRPEPAMQPCTVYLQTEADYEVRTAACGADIDVKVPTIAWIEGDGLISRSTVRLAPSEARELTLRMTAARTLSPSSPKADARLRIFADAGASGLFERWSAAEQSVRVPAGEALVLEIVRDHVTRISSPIPVRGDQPVALESSGDGGDLVTIFHAPLDASSEVEMRPADAEESPVAPRLRLQGDDRLVSVWSSVPTGNAAVRLKDSSHWYRDEVELRRNEVALVEAEPRRKPTLEVAFDEGQLEEEKVTVELMPRGTRTPLAKQELERSKPIMFENVDPAAYELLVSIDGFRFMRVVDMSSGDSTREHIELEPITLDGTVSVGGNPQAATLEFRNTRTVKTNDRGEYELRIWAPSRLIVSVLPEGRSGPGVTEMIKVDESRTVDFDLPDNHYVVRVVAARTGEPVAGASVGYQNRWVNPATGREQGDGQRLTTDASGAALLPPVRPGRLTVGATHEDYTASKPVERVVTATGSETIVIELTQVESGTKIRLLTAAGAPAAGAAVAMTLDALAGTADISMTADAKGEVVLPQELDERLVLVAHPGSGAFLQRFVAAAGDQTWQLPPAAAPLVIQAVDRTGEPLRHGRMIVWINGTPVAGLPLSFLTGGSGIDMHGLWRGRNLPAGPLRVVATTADPRMIVSTGQHESFSRTIGYPWPAEVTLEAIE